MSNEAKGLLAEADRLLNEARSLDPTVVSTTTVANTSDKPRGRPKKVAAIA
jgi:hypothetical protein